MSLDSSLGLTVLSKAKFLRLWTVRVKFYWCVPFVVAGHSQGQTWKGISSEPCRKPCQWHNQPPKAAASMHDVTIRSGLKAEAKCVWKIPPREKNFSKNLCKEKKNSAISSEGQQVLSMSDYKWQTLQWALTESSQLHIPSPFLQSISMPIAAALSLSGNQSARHWLRQQLPLQLPTHILQNPSPNCNRGTCWESYCPLEVPRKHRSILTRT